MSTPKIYPWSRKEVVRTFHRLATERLGDLSRSISPETGRPEIADELTRALFEITGRFVELSVNRLNQVPDKVFLDFLALADRALTLPAAARTALKFDTGPALAPGQIIPRGFQVATAPLANGDSLIFETLQPVRVQKPNLARVFLADHFRERYTDLTGFIDNQELPPAPLFRGDKEFKHRIYVTHPLFDSFGPQSDFSVLLKIKFENLSDLRNTPPPDVRPELVEEWSQEKHLPLVPILEGVEVGSIENGIELLDAIFGYDNPNDTAVKIAAGTTGNAVSGSVSGFPIAQTSIFRPGRVRSAFRVRFAPNGSVKWMLTGHEADAFAEVFLVPSFSLEPAANFTQALEVSVSYWTSETGKTTIPLGPLDVLEQNENVFDKDRDQITVDSAVYYRLGKIAEPIFPKTIRGFSPEGRKAVEKTGRFLVVEMSPKRPQRFGALRHPVPEILSVEFKLNRMAKEDAQRKVERRPISWVYADVQNGERAFCNAKAIDLTKSFFPFGEQPRFNDAFYLASKFFSRRGDKCCINLWLQGDLAGSPFESENDPALMPFPYDSTALVWEYFDGNDWEAMFGGRIYRGYFIPISGALKHDSDPEKTEFEDPSFSFHRSAHKDGRGHIFFKVPENIHRVKVNNVEDWWIRVRVLFGRFGQEAFVSLEGDKPKLHAADFRPPLVRSLTIDYVGEETSSALGFTGVIQKIISPSINEADTQNVATDGVGDDIQKTTKALTFLVGESVPSWVRLGFYFFDDFLFTGVLQRIRLADGEHVPDDADWQNSIDAPYVVQTRILDNRVQSWDDFWRQEMLDNFVREPGPDADIDSGLIRSRTQAGAIGPEGQGGVVMARVFGNFAFGFGTQPNGYAGGIKAEYSPRHYISFFFQADNRPCFEVRQDDKTKLIDICDELGYEDNPENGARTQVSLERRGLLSILRYSRSGFGIDGEPEWEFELEYQLDPCFPTGTVVMKAFQMETV